MVGYNLRSKRSLSLTGDQGAKSVALEPDLIQKTTLRETRRELEKLRTELDALKKNQEVAERKNQGFEKTVIPSADEIFKAPTPSSQTVTEWPLPIKCDSGRQREFIVLVDLVQWDSQREACANSPHLRVATEFFQSDLAGHDDVEAARWKEDVVSAVEP